MQAAAVVLERVALLPIHVILEGNISTFLDFIPTIIPAKNNMNWHTLTSEEQLEQVKLASNTKPQLLFKHSTRCSISSMALNRLNREADFPNVDFHLLDLIAYRNVSKKIADDFEVEHQSPQILLIKNGLCIFDESHGGINMQEIIEQAALAI